MNKFLVANFANILISCCLLFFGIGCKSAPLPIRTDFYSSKAGYEEMGEGTGSAVSLLWGLIPIGVNSKLERAYREAITSRNGDALLEPVIEETWFYTPIGHFFITTVHGKVIRRTYKKIPAKDVGNTGTSEQK